MQIYLLTKFYHLWRRHTLLLVGAASLLPATLAPGCEREIERNVACCGFSPLRGCCWDEPLQAGGWYRPGDPSACVGPTHPPIPACGPFPVSERLDEEGCQILFEDTAAEPCVCTPLDDGCEPICAVPEPPSLPDACAGATIEFENPDDCPAAGNVVTYVVTRIAADPDPTSGFDLDGTAGSSCREGALAVPDPPNRVDNSLASFDLSVLNREWFNRACKGDLSASFQVDANAEEACATVSVLDFGRVVSSAPLHLRGACLSGTLDRFLLPTAQDENPPLENVRLRATLDVTGFADMTIGATANMFASGLISDVLKEPSPFDAWLDIRADLDVTGDLQCDATSLTLELGGVVE